MIMAIQNLAVSGKNRAFCLSVLFCFSFITFSAIAEQIEVTLPDRIVARANFHSGLAARPAVLILHGFLQTHHSPPMSSLASNLSSRGYTVLNPTMSLNTNLRSQSMSCEAIHTHTMEGEVAEVGFWVNWLNNKGFKNIVIIGFSSTGNLAALLYTTQPKITAVKQLILISLNPLASPPDFTQATKTKSSKTSKGLKKYSLGYCKNNFTATEHSFQSYAGYNSNAVLRLLRENTVPNNIILGSADTILSADWAARINSLNKQIQVNIITNANHFFDDTYEFDLAEAVEKTLKNITKQ